MGVERDTGVAAGLRRHQTITLSLLFLAGIVNFLDRSSLSIANTTVRAEMHLNATQMGWLLSAFSFAYGLAQLPLIGLLDRVGTRLVLGGADDDGVCGDAAAVSCAEGIAGGG